MNGITKMEDENREPKFYSELKQTNDDLLKYIEANQKKSPHFDYTETFKSYIKQITDLKEQFPPGKQEVKTESKPLFSVALQQNNSSFSFANQTLNETNKTVDATKVEETGDDAEGEDAPPPEPNLDKYEETNVKFQCRCKLYERLLSKTEGNIPPRYIGCGELFVKEMESNKLHLIMRQDPDLRKVLLNQVITSSIPLKLFPKAVQFLAPSEDDWTKFYVTKVRDDKIASELFSMLNSVRS